MNACYGKYRGTVVNNVDPQQMGRLLVAVQDLAGGQPLGWAMPCVPFAGTKSGMYVLPAIGSRVWIEFERGDRNSPIWVGCFWGSVAEVPALAHGDRPERQRVIVQTTLGNTLCISDAPGPEGGILLNSAGGAMISVTDAGITISNGQGASIVMVGPSMNVNAGALEVT